MRPFSALAALCLATLLAACGGGASGTDVTPTPTPTPKDGFLSVTLAGGAGGDYTHLWVTVSGLAIHAEADRPFDDGDAGWVRMPLAAPLTVDLVTASDTQGRPVALLKSVVTKTGAYQQLRLILVAPDAALTASAAAAGLTWNDQVETVDADGTARKQPLELPATDTGLRLLTGFTISGDTTTPLAIEWNARDSLVRRASASGIDRHTLRPELHLYNQQLLSALADVLDSSILDAISGQLDTSHFCVAPATSGCIRDVVASATSLTPDGRFHRAVRSVNVLQSGAGAGSFILYPLPPDSLYDVVISGRNMQTIVVRNVFVDSTGLLQPAPTAIATPAAPLLPVLDTGERALTLASPLTPAGSRVLVGQTIVGSGGSGADAPYQIAARNADPATGHWQAGLIVPAGPLHVAVFDFSAYLLGQPLAFSTVDPAEGQGAFSTWTQGSLFDDLGATTLIGAGASSFTPAMPPRNAAWGTGQVDITVTGSSSADQAELLVWNAGGIVSVIDASALIATHGGTRSIALPQGVLTSAPGAAVYTVALRTWSAASEAATEHWTRSSTLLDLRVSGSAAASLAFP